MEFKKILVPVDGSETAEKAFKVGLDMAIKHNAELFLLYVADMNDAAYPVLQVTLDENGFISMRKKAEEVLSNLKAQIPVGTRLTALVKIGDPGRVIMVSPGTRATARPTITRPCTVLAPAASTG